MTHGLALDASRPLTEEERKAADRDVPVGERVYAPASERVPRTVAGHRDIIEHTDTQTPERQSAGRPTPESAFTPESSTEPSFTRVPRPSTTPGVEPTPVPETPTAATWTPTPGRRRLWLPLGVGWGMLFWGGMGVWLWTRWQRERNKPINRMRRQARQTAHDIRDHMPSRGEATRPAVGLSTALLSIGVLMWQQSRARSQSRQRVGRGRADRAARRTSQAARQAAQAISDIDWQQRLARLKERWTASRLELEKTFITHKP
jgi:hypothetical protein